MRSRRRSSLAAVTTFVYLAIALQAESTTAFVPSTYSKATIGRDSSTKRYFFDKLLKKDEPEPPKPERDEDESAGSDDPIDKIFGFFFGQKEEAPMGMKRFGRGEKCCFIRKLALRVPMSLILVYKTQKSVSPNSILL